jgi:hypothetical protein
MLNARRRSGATATDPRGPWARDARLFAAVLVLGVLFSLLIMVA